MGRLPGSQGAELREVEAELFGRERDDSLRWSDHRQRRVSVPLGREQLEEGLLGAELLNVSDPPDAVANSDPVSGTEAHGHRAKRTDRVLRGRWVRAQSQATRTSCGASAPLSAPLCSPTCSALPMARYDIPSSRSRVAR
jgi:hypothetical protein